MTATELRDLLRAYRYGYSDEATLQCCIAGVLDAHSVEFEREHRLDARNRLDFLVGSVGIEVKIGGSRNDLIRQLHRYAQFDAIGELLVVSSRMRLTSLPEALNGKPIVSLALLGGFA